MSLIAVHAAVFSLTEGGGNPCWVVLGGTALSRNEKQEVALQFGEETVFILSVQRKRLRLGYFAPQQEMEFCTHATIASVAALVAGGTVTSSPLWIETEKNHVACAWQPTAAGTRVSVEQLPPSFQPPLELTEDILQSLSLGREAVDLGLGPLQVVSTFRPKLLIPIRHHADLDAIRPEPELLWRVCERVGSTGFYPFTLHPRNPEAGAEARQFPLRAGFLEDPATGVAASALASYFAKYNIRSAPAEGWNSWTIEQGWAMEKPSSMVASCLIRRARIVKTRITGTARLTGGWQFIGR